MKSSSVLLISFIVSFVSLPLSGQFIADGPSQTSSQIIGKIIEKTGSAIIPNTVDVIKEGSPETVVTGIVTSMFGTMNVLRKAVDLNCNLIIVHEPLYYNHLDQTKQFQNDPVFLEKQKFIKDHNLVVWRFHDYIHSIEPDGILSGMVLKLGWKDYVLNNNTDQFVIPETSLKGLLQYLKEIFPKNAFYVIGDPEMRLSKVRFAPGAPGSNYHIRLLEKNDADVLIAGEVPQWETYEYMRDAVDQGRKKAVIFLGHINSEEAGMEFCAGWLKGFISDVPVHFVESGPSFWSY
jgi:putative NIF3 family GTP cyclohydrolase 1 type 2